MDKYIFSNKAMIGQNLQILTIFRIFKYLKIITPHYSECVYATDLKRERIMCLINRVFFVFMFVLKGTQNSYNYFRHEAD